MYIGETGVDKRYCEAKNITLSVSTKLSSPTDLFIERKKALEAACLVWNAIDRSGRRRIQISGELEFWLDIVPGRAISHNVIGNDGGHFESSKNENNTTSTTRHGS